MKRQLNSEELMLSTKIMKQRKEELEWIEYQILYHELMLSKGLEMNHRKNVRDFKGKKKDFDPESTGIAGRIGTLAQYSKLGR